MASREDKIERARTESAVMSMTMEDMIDAIFTLRDALTAAEEERDRLRKALKTCRAYAVHPVSLDDCFVIFNAADAALHTTETEGSDD